MEEKDKILDTGGGVLNAIHHFSNEPFLIINPDTIWNVNYLEELKLMQKKFFENKRKCILLLVKKEKSFEKFIKGEFNLKNELVSRNKKDQLEYKNTGIQLIRPEVFHNIDVKIFSLNKIWDQLILKKELYAIESNIKFLHISTLDIYKSLLKKLYVK